MVRAFRSTAAVASTALIVTLISPVAPALAAEQVEIPVLAGTDVLVGDTLAGVGLSMFYPSVPVDTTALFTIEDWDPDGFGSPPAGSFPIAYVQSYLANYVPIGQDVTSCFDYSLVADPPQDIVVYTDATLSGELEPVLSFTAEPNVTCVTESGLIRTGIYMLSSDETAPPTNADLTVTRVEGPAPILQGVFGEGDINGSHLQVEVTNNDIALLRLGLGADLRVQGVDEKLWLGSTFGLDGAGIDVFGGLFVVDVEPGESATLTVPDWPGKSFTFHSIDVGSPERSVILGSYDTGGLFVPLIIDINAGIGEVGSVAGFAGDRVFPGATTTVSADGLIPGGTYGLWLTPGVDYFAFLITGAVLAEDAIRVGEGTVGADGRLRATFAVPHDVVVGNRYQLMVGDPATRSWPAGTLSQITIQAPEFSSTVALPTSTEGELQLAAGDFSIAFSFPPGTTSGQTVASVSSTGPAAVGFSLIGEPNAYMHLSTTAEFTGLVEVCVSNGDLVDPTDARLYHYVLVGDSFRWVDITTRYDGDSVCGETDSFSPFALGLPDLDISFATVDGNPFGFGPDNGTYLSVDITNNGSSAVTVGLGADMMVEGESVPLWLLESWGLDPVADADVSEGLVPFFTRTIEPGDTLSEPVPDFPGKTYSIWQLDVEGSGVDQIIDSYTTKGLFTPLGIDLVEGWFTLGAEATFAGDSVFPGATTTVEAEGLIPGETYELWLTPGADYFSFMFTGAALDEDAVKVGSATVNAFGRLATAFTVPVSVQVNDQYQLMIGDPATRSWPAGTAYAITIDAADESSTVDGPVVEQLEVSIPLGDTNVLFSFPAGTTDGQTTASLSSTGPAAVGFTMPTNPPVYLHLSTTAEFDGMVEVCVSVPAGTDPADLSLYHYDLTSVGYVWVDITTRRTSTAVCGETDSFSPFALGVPDGVRLLTKDQCKNGGWATSTLPTFRNQGLCVMYFVRVR